MVCPKSNAKCTGTGTSNYNGTINVVETNSGYDNLGTEIQKLIFKEFINPAEALLVQKYFQFYTRSSCSSIDNTQTLCELGKSKHRLVTHGPLLVLDFTWRLFPATFGKGI